MISQDEFRKIWFMGFDAVTPTDLDDYDRYKETGCLGAKSVSRKGYESVDDVAGKGEQLGGEDLKLLDSLLTHWQHDISPDMDPTFYETGNYDEDMKIKNRLTKIFGWCGL